MRFPGQMYNKPLSPADRQFLRYQTENILFSRGTSQVPPPPRGIVVQSAPRGLYITWSEPDPKDGRARAISGWRIYKDDENTLYEEIHDRGTKQKFIETTAGTTPPVTNIFISSINRLGAESQKVQAKGAATAETGAPTMPNVPPEYNTGYSGGGNKKYTYQL